MYTVGVEVCCQSNCSDRVGSVSLTLNLRLDTVEYADIGGAFLNLNQTSACGGQVMGWRFCYYVREGVNETDFDVPLMVGAWRRLSDTAYQLINESFQPLPISPLREGIQFLCQRWILPSELQFIIDPGSVVGVYFPETAKATYLITKERIAAVTYFREGEVEDIYFIPVESLVEMSGFALYVQALMGE